MIRRRIAILTSLSLVLIAPAVPLAAQEVVQPGVYANDQARYSPNQLDNLVGPIALYPDALLAQVLVASTFPDQIEEAARYVRANGTNGIDDQSWDVSVKAVAHYASALNMMADKSDWTATLGRAYAYQSSDVMASVQRMRGMAAQQGNLVSTPQQNVITEGSNYVIAPAQPRVIYVPVYDPVVVYTRPVFSLGFSSRYWSFGVGFPIGGWLSYDCDWRSRVVYYNGWDHSYYGYGGGWRSRSRPFIQITNVYVNPRYRNVYINRDIMHRQVNYRNVDRYAGVHRDTWFDRRGDSRDNWRNNDRNDYRDDNRNGRDRARPEGYATRSAPPRDGRNGDVGRRIDDNAVRIAQPRDAERRDPQQRNARPGVIPEGNRVGGSDRIIRRDDPPRNASPQGVVPDRRRNEPQARDVRMAPDVNRSAPPNREVRIAPEVNRGSQPNREVRTSPEVNRGSQPNREVRRAPEVNRAPQARIEPRQAPRQEPQRQAQPRGGSGQQQSAPGGARSRSGNGNGRNGR